MGSSGGRRPRGSRRFSSVSSPRNPTTRPGSSAASRSSTTSTLRSGARGSSSRRFRRPILNERDRHGGLLREVCVHEEALAVGRDVVLTARQPDETPYPRGEERSRSLGLETGAGVHPCGHELAVGAEKEDLAAVSP